jgi:HEAT repeat protein
LLEALHKDEDPAARRIAAVALGELGAGNIGSFPEAAREGLRGLAAHAPEADLRRAAQRALARLEGRAARPPQEER